MQTRAGGGRFCHARGGPAGWMGPYDGPVDCNGGCGVDQRGAGVAGRPRVGGLATVALASVAAAIAVPSADASLRQGAFDLAANPELPAGVDLVRLSATYDAAGALEGVATMRGPVASGDSAAIALAAGRMTAGTCGTNFAEGGVVGYAPLHPDQGGPLLARVGMGQDFSEGVSRRVDGVTVTLRVEGAALAAQAWDCVVIATVPVPITPSSRPYDLGAAFALRDVAPPATPSSGQPPGVAAGGDNVGPTEPRQLDTPPSAFGPPVIRGARSVRVVPGRWQVVRLRVSAAQGRALASHRVALQPGGGVVARLVGSKAANGRSLHLPVTAKARTRAIAVRVRLGRPRVGRVRLVVGVGADRRVHTLRVLPLTARTPAPSRR